VPKLQYQNSVTILTEADIAALSSARVSELSDFLRGEQAVQPTSALFSARRGAHQQPLVLVIGRETDRP